MLYLSYSISCILQFTVRKIRMGPDDQGPNLLRMSGHIYYSEKSNMDQPGKVASPARGQLNRKNEYFPVRVRA